MSAKWQRVAITIPKAYGPQEREAIAIDVIDLITKRTKKGLDKTGDTFPSYSESYKKSLDFKIAKGGGKPNLTLSGDMLSAMELLNHASGKILIGYENGTTENAKADGNIRGTYGQSSPIKGGKYARDFLGISKKELDAILKKYPIDNRERAENVTAANREARGNAADVDVEDV